jgi:predicted  nucleic acid-binding Zn-ribbon protein
MMQATKSKKDAERQIADSTSKIKKERASVKSLETELNREEQVLEEITDSLKGKIVVFVTTACHSHHVRQDASLP